MSSLNIFQQFVDSQTARKHVMTLPNPVCAILDYAEYSIRMDFNLSEKTNYLSKKSKKRQIPKQMVEAFVTLSREEKIQYYCMVIGFMINFIKGHFEPPKSVYSGMLNTVAFSRSFNIKRWKQKQLRLDLDKHLMFAERESKIKSYDLRNYILRKSKNKQYYCFVLEAINKNPPEKSMTVHIGFTKKQKYQEWLAAIKYSVSRRQWQMYLDMFNGNNLTKSVSARMYTTDDVYSKTSQDLKKERQNSDACEEMMMTSSLVVTPTFKEQERSQNLKMKAKGLEFEKMDRRSSETRPVQFSNPKKQQDIERQIKQKQKLESEIQQYEAHKQIGKSFVGDLMEGDVFEQPDVFQEKIQEQDEITKASKRHLDLFHKLYPQYQLDQLEIFANYEVLHEAHNFKICQNTLMERRLKLLVVFDKAKYSTEQVMSMLSKPETSHLYNDNIESSQLKTFIPSQNSAVMYQVNKAYNRLYRSRDFVFIRHVFNQKNTVYMVDKSIQNANYPPFLTIVRGTLCNVYGVFTRKDTIELIADIQMQNGGITNPVQETNVTLKYLKGYSKLLEAEIGTELYKFFELDWDITKNKANDIENEIREKRKTLHRLEKNISHDKGQDEPKKEDEPRNFAKKTSQTMGNTIKSQTDVRTPPKQIKGVQHDNSPANRYQKGSSLQNRAEVSPSERQDDTPPQKKYDIKQQNKNNMDEVGEINQEDLKATTISNVNRKLDAEGMVIIDKSYLKKQYLIDPLKNVEKKPLTSPLGHPIWKNQWVHDDKDGGMVFIHKQKIQDQKGVLKFILSKIAKNLVSGQSITNISLPVDIFSAESNLQRFLFSMAYAPSLLQNLSGENVVKRIIRTFIFGLSNSILYLSMQKPFNPILGQTFQCWINGCPAYADQISHHPPIGALMFKGRGYDITAQLQSKVSLGMNSGTGTNDGIYRVKFDDDVEICFITPGGEVSGLTAGDRRFNIVGKSYYWVSNTNIMMEIVFDPAKKGFFSIGKQEKPSDYFEGTIYEVKPEFMNKFINGKRREPEEKERVKQYGKINGIWNKYVCFNGNQVFSFDREYPVILEYEANPLPSDANWREDIEYRRKNQVTRAQTQKERLQVLQRKDRKLREKHTKKK